MYDKNGNIDKGKSEIKKELRCSR